MATPRLFISSTCYDLKEVRHQLRSFIEEIGYEPVMSEYGDIFYDYKKHVQDSCKEEINKCQFFVLIIGNNYGSFYHKQQDNSSPDSVTLQELKKALETNIYKHIFINKYVDYDYKNYLTALKKYIAENLITEDLNDEDYQKIITNLKEEFRKIYFYPQESYKYIFNFLDLIYGLDSNNAIIPYESFDDIKNSLRKQWAGFMYDSIEKDKNVSIKIINNVEKKIDKIELQLRKLIENQIKNENPEKSISLDLKTLVSEQYQQDFQELKEKIDNLLNSILKEYNEWGHESYNRIRLKGKIKIEELKSWVFNLKELTFKYKWTSSISAEIIFETLKSKIIIKDGISEIPTNATIQFSNLLGELESNLTSEEYENLIESILLEINKLFYTVTVVKKIETTSEPDDLPF
jgi:hypothetical protein